MMGVFWCLFSRCLTRSKPGAMGTGFLFLGVDYILLLQCNLTLGGVARNAVQIAYVTLCVCASQADA